MASSTSSAIAAPTEPEETLNAAPARQGDDSTAEAMATDTNSSSALPNGRGAMQRTSFDPLLNPQNDENDDNDDNNHRDKNDDDGPAPFPPYRELDEVEDQELEEMTQSPGHDPIQTSVSPATADSNPSRPQTTSDADEPPTEPNAETTPEQTSELSAEHPPTSTTTLSVAQDSEATLEMTSEPASEPTREEATDAATTTTSSSAPVTSPPAPPPPPPYWTHSRDGSQGQNIRNDNASLDAGRPATSAPAASKPTGAAAFFSAPFLRRLDSSSRSQGRASSSAPSAAQRPATSAVQPSTSNGGNGSRNHRRETSSSTLDFQANIITLQDNEASDDEEGGEDGYSGSQGWQYNGASSFLANDGASSSAVSSPTALLSPGPPPGSSGSNISRGSIATTSSVTRTASNSSRANRCWARRVDITDHTLIGAGGNGNKAALPHMGAFVVWTIRVQTLDSTSSGGGSGRTSSSPQSPTAGGHSFCVYKRYSEFDTLRKRLLASFPQARGGGALPPLPPKTVLGNFKPEFLEKRRLGLQYFLNCILLNPEFAGSPVLQDFLFS
ncbi:hypothetical protein SBRCBS47491_005482 [Sporothrix bragantina]|uniref:Endosomal/vacuolar adapter protein YPT35 n=1 Tax=Sporothrix bragantina TaxID=671064 RepID=A0ABP0BX99_9PEZI